MRKFLFHALRTCPVAAANAQVHLLLENDFEFFKVQLPHFEGEVGKFTVFWCEIFSGFHLPKIIQIHSILTELFKKYKNL